MLVHEHGSWLFFSHSSLTVHSKKYTSPANLHYTKDNEIRVKLKMILDIKKQDESMWIEFIWLRTGDSGRLLCKR